VAFLVLTAPVAPFPTLATFKPVAVVFFVVSEFIGVITVSTEAT